MSKCRVILNVLNPSIIHGLYFLKTDRSRIYDRPRVSDTVILGESIERILFHLTAGAHSSEMNYDERTMRHVGESVLCD